MYFVSSAYNSSTPLVAEVMPDIGVTNSRKFSNKVSEAVGGELHSFNPHTGKKVWNMTLSNFSSTFKGNLESFRDAVNFTRDSFTFYDSLNPTLTSRTTIAEDVDFGETHILVNSLTGLAVKDIVRIGNCDGVISSIGAVDDSITVSVGSQGGIVASDSETLYEHTGNYTVRFVSGLQFQEISIGRYSTSFVLKEVAPS